MNQEAQTTKEPKQEFIYPKKVNGISPLYYTITAESVEDEESFEGCYDDFFIESAGVKIPLEKVLNQILATSELSKKFIEFFERVEIMMNAQAAYFKNRRKTDLENAKKLEGKTKNFIEVCRPTYKALKKFNQD